MTLKNKNTYNILLTGIITAILVTSGIGIAYAADTEHSGTLEVGNISTNIASGANSAAFGDLTTASGDNSAAFGYYNTASGHESAAFGVNNTASGRESVVFGHSNIANGAQSAAFGGFTNTIGTNVAAFGHHTTAQSYASFVIGQYNEISGTTDSWVAIDPLFVIGNGDAATANNAVTVLKNGNMGIGISAPTEPLQVAGIIESTTGGFKFPDGTTQTTASVDTNLWTQSGNNLSYTTGNVGIGTSSPSADLEIRGTGNAIVWDNGKAVLRHHYDALTWDRMWFNVFLDADNNQDSSKFQIFNDVSSSSGNTAVISFSLDGKNSWIDSGNVGIGTTTPNSALQVTGYIQLDTSEGTPPSADCDASDEYGRMKVDSRIVSSNLYVCTPSGWDIK